MSTIYRCIAAAAATTIGFSTFPRDRAHVFIDGVVATAQPLYRPTYNGSVPLTVHSGKKLQILIENMGRLNYGAGTSMRATAGICICIYL